MITIRPASGKDLAAVTALLESSGLPSEDLTPTHMEYFLLLWEGESLVGSAGLELYPPIALLRSLAVEEHLQRQGLGSRILGEIEANVCRDGIQTIYLLTTTAEKFFHKHGYKPIERDEAPAELQGNQEFQTLCPSSAVCMVKSFRFT